MSWQYLRSCVKATGSIYFSFSVDLRGVIPALVQTFSLLAQSCSSVFGPAEILSWVICRISFSVFSIACGKLSNASVVIASRRMRIKTLIPSMGLLWNFWNFWNVKHASSDVNCLSTVREGSTGCSLLLWSSEHSSLIVLSCHQERSLSPFSVTRKSF